LTISPVSAMLLTFLQELPLTVLKDGSEGKH
jgi:hypothetical protein